ncbi:flagellar basal body P-ring formation chaperone FlgA [Zobellella aerophila]|uniref:Flagella basal body P-ring formation protein FlgA n=1 Tax=Zobellella aerophila TaxID=870480 RepID=A0ABP6VWG5_9GAMM
MPHAVSRGRFPQSAWSLPSLLLLLSALLTPARASASTLMEAVHSFLYQQTHQLGEDVTIDVFPPSAQLPPCDHPQPFFPGNGQRQWGRVAVAVRCGEQGEQVRYMQAQIRVLGHYPVAARAIAAGTRIDADMIELRQGDLGSLPRQALLDADEAIGQLARRPLAAGTVIQRHQLRELPLVERGQRVVLEAAGAGFRITREGKAMESGAMGERVRVKVAAREILTGEVVGRGRLAVGHQPAY